MKKFTPLFALAMLLSFNWLGAQTIEELEEQKTAKEAELAEASEALKAAQAKVDALTGEVADLKEKTTPYPREDFGTSGTIGLSFAGFRDWLGREQPSTDATTITIAGGAYANVDWEKYFWRNNMNLTAAWLAFDDRDDTEDDDSFQTAADAFNVSSLFGYKINDKWAVSALGEYRSTIIDNFNDPGYLDLGAGATWTPITDLVAVFHPVNYNFVFSNQAFDFQSSLGCKIVADYKRQLTKKISWKTNLSAFVSYEGSDLHNWTWINGFSTAYKGIGIGLDLGLRSNKQEALALMKTDNPLQLYYVLGFAYSI